MQDLGTMNNKPREIGRCDESGNQPPDILRTKYDAANLCERCQNIDLPRAFQRWNKALEEDVLQEKVSMELKLGLPPHGCPLCKIFEELKSMHPFQDPHTTWELRAYRLSDVIPDLPRRENIVAIEAKNASDTLPLSHCFLAPLRGNRNASVVSAQTLGVQVDWKLVRSWLAFCRSKHWKHCTQETTSVLSGLQVIDCTTRQLVGAPSTCEYVTLSYVWGQIPAGNLVSSTLPDDLPNTVRDSIQAVLCLGYRYLWIDRFCVPQEAGPDRHRLINSMDIIYGNAALTLIAAAGEDPSHGLPGVDEKRTRRPQSSIKINDITYVVVNLNPRTSILQSHWNTRGWTYQETLLSHRKLVFTETGVYFQCGVMNCFEDLHIPFHVVHPDDGQDRSISEAFCRQVFPSQGIGTSSEDIYERLNEFAVRDLTFEQDALHAFQGIFKAFKRKYLVKTFYGIRLWEYDDLSNSFLTGLTWGIRGHATRRAIFPSWTFAGWKLDKRSIFHHDLLVKSSLIYRDSLVIDSTVSVGISVEYSDNTISRWGEVCHDLIEESDPDKWPKILHLSGKFVDLKISNDLSWPVAYFVDDLELGALQAYLWATFVHADSNNDVKVMEVEIVGLLVKQLESNLQFLLFAKVDEPSTYERVGGAVFSSTQHLSALKVLDRLNLLGSSNVRSIRVK